mmetsp:Transcript_3695/g.4914  ORF Transcript_3695/g.4914 Transcript_3695/m.4914 type:complete len:717 (+) Transcript_3695:57-2207(+)|eukprot:CAMPEP_0114382600 /NCGR_PEP_ID=MMETSP0102-20121206/4203_1 /TAXON_ID=38822 ORGANISM="Pteridomonas danica, Strain PT" /NCGR_SAMPLE_ID=MMETSP0102 /ASSEMBLY_ACC=CAM_ASM_000212 /LENGTH=716 /DNA_ID=CAMNT_0001538427 /DNA_START=53 /DNA_END=2203 /DNA_ORIENTATION=-
MADDGLEDFINEVQQQEIQKDLPQAGGMIDKIRRASSASLKKHESSDSNDNDEMRLSQIGANPNNDVNQFVNTVTNVDSKLSALQMRHLQAEYLWGYEADRRSKAESLGTEVMTLGRDFARRVDTGISELEALSNYLKARGAAERAYAAAVAKSTEQLNKAGDDCRVLFQNLDLNMTFPKVMEFAAILDESLPEDVQALLEEIYAFAAKAKTRIGKLHTYFLKSERALRDEHRNLVKAFNNMLDHLRTNAASLVGTPSAPKSNLDPSNDPWLIEQAYRARVQAANRHAENYIQELGKLEDELIVLGQKRAVVVMCSKKIVLFETVKLHTESSQKLEFISKHVRGDKGLLEGHKTIDGAPSNLNDNLNYEMPVRLSEGDEDESGDGDEGDKPEEEAEKEEPVAPKECKYSFHMPLPPPGTHAYEENLSFIIRDVAENELSNGGIGAEFLAKEFRKAAVEELCADTKNWKSVRAVLTNERILHLYDNNGTGETSSNGRGSDSGAGGESGNYGGAVTQLPIKSINCRRSGIGVEGVSGGGAGASIRRSYYAGAEEEEEEAPDDEDDESPASCCFEIMVTQQQSIMKSFNLFGSSKSKSTSDHYLFRAEDKRALEIWLKILSDDSVNLGDPIAIATCVDTGRRYSDEDADDQNSPMGSDDEADWSRDSISADAMEQLMKLTELPEIEEVRTSIFRAASDDDDDEASNMNHINDEDDQNWE